MLFNFIEYHDDQQLALSIRLPGIGVDLDGERTQSVVASERITSSELDEAAVAPQVDHERLQVLDVSGCQFGAQPVHQCLH
ncbi:hypothetical protein D3C87_1926120 [compost metagenome]